jgi:DNA-binding NtrC family response regulator
MTQVLVVDDQPNWRDVLTSLLTDMGCMVEAVGGLSEAQQLMKGDVFGVAIIDVRLTDDNPYDVQGVELLEHMQGQTDNPMPVVIMTGYAFEGLEETLKTRYGVQHFVKKGTLQDIREFRAMLVSILSNLAEIHPAAVVDA